MIVWFDSLENARTSEIYFNGVITVLNATAFVAGNGVTDGKSHFSNGQKLEVVGEHCLAVWQLREIKHTQMGRR